MLSVPRLAIFVNLFPITKIETIHSELHIWLFAYYFYIKKENIDRFFARRFFF